MFKKKKRNKVWVKKKKKLKNQQTSTLKNSFVWSTGFCMMTQTSPKHSVQDLIGPIQTLLIGYSKTWVPGKWKRYQMHGRNGLEVKNKVQTLPLCSYLSLHKHLTSSDLDNTISSFSASFSVLCFKVQLQTSPVL